jgi:hypothetical protein
MFRVKLEHVANASPDFEIEIQPIALVLTQACDLDLDFRQRFPSTSTSNSSQSTDKMIPCVLFCEVVPAEEMFGRVRQLGSKIWARIKQNDDPRYQFLQKPGAECDAFGEELTEFAIDFKRYLALPTAEVYKRVALGEARRRCILRSPYLESVCQRFANYLSRIGLPEPHFSV